MNAFFIRQIYIKKNYKTSLQFNAFTILNTSWTLDFLQKKLTYLFMYDIIRWRCWAMRSSEIVEISIEMDTEWNKRNCAMALSTILCMCNIFNCLNTEKIFWMALISLKIQNSLIFDSRYRRSTCSSISLKKFCK